MHFDSFVEIRGLSILDRVSQNQIVELLLHRKHFCHAKIINIRKLPIQNLSIGFLRELVEYPGYHLHCHSDFLDFLNSFRDEKYPRATLDSDVALLTFIKITDSDLSLLTNPPEEVLLLE